MHYLNLSEGEKRLTVVNFELSARQSFHFGLLERTFERINPSINASFEVVGDMSLLLSEIEKTRTYYDNLRRKALSL